MQTNKQLKINRRDEILICHFTDNSSQTGMQWVDEMQDYLSQEFTENPIFLMLVFHFTDDAINPHVVFRTGSIIQHSLELAARVACVIEDPTAHTLIGELMDSLPSHDTQCSVFLAESSGWDWLKVQSA